MHNQKALSASKIEDLRVPTLNIFAFLRYPLWTIVMALNLAVARAEEVHSGHVTPYNAQRLHNATLRCALAINGVKNVFLFPPTINNTGITPRQYQGQEQPTIIDIHDHVEMDLQKAASYQQPCPRL